MYKSFSEVKVALAAGKSVVNIVNDYLKVIDEKKHLNAFLEVFEKSVLEQSETVDSKIKNGTAGRLAGMDIPIKYNI